MTAATIVRGAGTSGGYRMVRVDGRRLYEHRYVMEQLLGRPLATDEHVHHINGERMDNREENLEVLSAAEHTRTHKLGRPLNGTRAVVVSLHTSGHVQTSIARSLGIDQSTVSRHLRAHHGSPRPACQPPKGAQ